MSVLTIVLLTLHIFAAVLFVGGATLAASVFPRHVARHWDRVAQPVGQPVGQQVAQDGGREHGDQREVLRALARATRGYGRAALLVPAFGLVLAALSDRLGEAWLDASLVLAAVAAYLLTVTVQTQQAQLRLVREDTGGEVPERVAADLRRLRVFAGLFNTTWLVILLLMVWRPGGHL